MPANIVKCTQCGTDLDLSSFFMGQVVACPCGAQLTVPAPAIQPAQPQHQAPRLQQTFPPPQPLPGTPPGILPPGQPMGGPFQQATIPCKEANQALTFAIISIFCLGIILGPIAIVKANAAQKMIQADPRLDGAGKASAAKIIGIIVTVLSAIGVIFWMAGLAGSGLF